MANIRPLGFPVADSTPGPRPSRTTLQGRTVTLEPIRASHAEELYPHIGGEEHRWLWDYMTADPALSLEDLRRLLGYLAESPDSVVWAVKPHTSETGDPPSSAVGYIGLLNIVAAHRTVELGHVMYSTSLQRTTAASEAVYLLMRYVFCELGYRRVEWKCNNLNEPSKRAALRYGFQFEGVFRQHLIMKGRNRDTAWFSMLDSEWTGEQGRGIQSGFEQWLDDGNFDSEGNQKRPLNAFLQNH